jgi:hypothetical protein
MSAQRERRAARVLAHGRHYDPVAVQGNTCAMGGEPFEEGQPVFIDHDHACCRLRNPRAADACAVCCA